MLHALAGFFKKLTEWYEEFRGYGALVGWTGIIPSLGCVSPENVEVSLQYSMCHEHNMHRLQLHFIFCDVTAFLPVLSFSFNCAKKKGRGQYFFEIEDGDYSVYHHATDCGPF